MASLAVLAVGLGLAGCGNRHAEAPPPAPPSVEPASPRIASAEAIPGPEFDIEPVDATRYVIGDDVLVEIALAISTGEISATPEPRGLRLEVVPDGSILARLDLAAADLVVTINDLPIPGPAALRQAHAAIRRDGEVRLGGERAGAPLTRRYVLRSSVDDAQRAPTVARSHPATDRLLAALATGVKQTGEAGFDIDRQLLAAIADHPEMLEDTTQFGWRTRGVQADPRQPAGFMALGLSKYDIVKAINDVDTDRESHLARELGAQRDASHFTISVVRLREPMILRYRVVEDLVMDADLAAAVADWLAEDGARRRRGIDDLSPPDPDPPAHDGISKVAENQYEITRDTLDRVLAAPTEVARGARVVPSIKDGQPNGFKLYAVRPSSIYAALGLRNGDTILTINGLDLSSPDRALEAYAKLRSATKLELEIVRRGKPLRLEYRIK